MSVECGVECGVCGVCVKCGVWSVECGVCGVCGLSVGCGMWSVGCGVWGVVWGECGWWCGVLSVERVG